MEARVLHVECIEEQLEIDPPSRVADAAQLHEGVLAIAPSALNMMERKRSRGVNCVHVLGSNQAAEASPFLPRALTCETGKSGRTTPLRRVHSMHSMPVDQSLGKIETRATAHDANDADAEDDAEHLAALYESMVKQQEWLGAEILRIKQRLHTRVYSNSVGNMSTQQGQVEAVRGVGVQGAGPNGLDGPDGSKRQKRYKAFRDDTAIAVGHNLEGKGLASRMLSEPEAQSIGPMMERSIDREKSERIERGMRRSASRTGLKRQGLDDDQLSLCDPGEPWDRDPVSRSRGSSPPRQARSPPSPGLECQGSPHSPRSREVVTTNDSVDMQRRRTGSKRNVTGNQSQYNSGKSSYEAVPTRTRLEVGHRDGKMSHRDDHRDHGDQGDQGDHRNRRDCRASAGYYRARASESCPDLLRAHGGHIQSLNHQGPSNEVYPEEYAHQPHRSFSPYLNQMMGHGIHSVPQMQSLPLQAMPFPPMQSMPMPYGQMQPLHPMQMQQLQQMQQMQQMQYIQQQFPRSYYGGMQMDQMQQPLMQMPQARMQPTEAPNSIAGQAAAALQNVLNEASKLQGIKPAGQKKSKTRGKNRKKPTYPPHDDHNLSQRESGDAKVPTDSLAGTPRTAHGPSETSEPPLADIHDLNLTPEELDTLFEDLDLPNLG